MTALGINNNGELIFPYGKEDTDYNIDGNAASGYVFNGATSVFWCRLRDLLPGEITTTFQNVASECFSAENLINQFDEYQECYPEEIWRLDVQRKYIRTFTGESIDNSKPKKDPNYLRDMMQGRKKYQRRQWIRDQEIYFGTKNLMNTVVGDNNRITFRCYTPTNDDVVVQPDYTLKITPYSDMYVSAMFGNGDTRQIRAKAGQPYELKFVPSTTDDTQVTIYGANRIQALNDLSACYLTTINISMADKLKKLVLGNKTPGYSNPRLTALSLGNNRLLEELDIRNCNNLTGSINLSECNNLLKLYAEGTSLTGVIFSTNGKVQVAHLPETINTLTMRNLNDLSDFQATLEALETLTLQGGTLNSLEFINNCIDTLQVLYLYDIDWTGNNSLTDSTLLNQIYSLFYSMVTGKVYISGQVRNQELINYENSWKDLEVSYNPDNLVTQYLVTYVNADDANTVLYETYVDRGATPPDPVANGWISAPTKESTAKYDFEYIGWDDISSSVLSPKTIVAQYSENIRKYNVTWYSRPGLSLGSVEANYGEEAVYSGGLPTRTDEEGTYTYSVFTGWDKSTGFIKENTDVYALWNRTELPTIGTDMSNMSSAEIYGIATAGLSDTYFELKDYRDITLGHDFNFTNVESEILAEELYLDGKTAKNTGIKLFDENQKSFTMAIDFQFTSTKNGGTLLSCFEEDGSEGFRLRYGSNPNIQWGNVNQDVGYSTKRDIVVIRYIKEDNKLHVYSSNGSTANVFSDKVFHTELTRNRSTLTQAEVILGAVQFLGDGGYDYYGKGIIHWCKVWYEDLGEDNALKLASWYHETMRIEFSGSNRYRLAGNTSQRANFSCIANNLFADRGYMMNATNVNTGGWNSALMKTLCNSRIFKALPIEWQAIIKTVKVNSSAGDKSEEMVTSEDKIYLPCNTEITNNSSSPYIEEGEHIAWYTSASLRAKFKGHIIPDDATYYSSATDPSSVGSNSVKDGDIWVTGSNTCCIYVRQEDIEKYGITPTYNAAIGGGWIIADNWWLRSPNVSYSTYFMMVTNNGNVNLGSSNSDAGVCIGFSI